MFHSWLWFAKEIAEEISPKADCSRWLDAQAWYLPFDLPMLPSKDILMKLWDQDKAKTSGICSNPVRLQCGQLGLSFDFFFLMAGAWARSCWGPLHKYREKRINWNNDRVGCMDFLWPINWQGCKTASRWSMGGKALTWLFQRTPSHFGSQAMTFLLLRSFACRSSRWLLRVQRFLIFGWLGWLQHAFYYKYSPEA